MAMRFKLLTQVLMIFLALGYSMPEAICANSTPQAAKSSCCGDHMTCTCHQGAMGMNSCAMKTAPVPDKSLPVNEAPTLSPRVDVALFTLVPVVDPEPVSAFAFDRFDTNASPPLSGHSPQAVLRLWRV